MSNSAAAILDEIAGATPGFASLIDHLVGDNRGFPGPSEIKIPPLLDLDGQLPVAENIEEASAHADERPL